MNRRDFLTTAAAAALLGTAAQAGSDTIQDEILRQLTAQGFTHIQVSRTLLGRLRFVATSARHRREIIVNARTGEILRDYWETLGGTGEGAPRLIDSESGSGSGSGDSSDDGSDDRTDDSSDDSRDEPDDREDPPETEREDRHEDRSDSEGDD